ncbi:MAG: PCRF domain-containing protein [Patescibacteria group bacterium]|nr:PCRF domain-containing protein [Patescibacteria group bacterium]
MADNKEQLEQKIAELEVEMAKPEFWQNKLQAQEVIAEHGQLKAELAGAGQYNKGNAIITIFSGAGGDDAEDFSRMLLEMYFNFAKRRDLEVVVHHENKNDHGGYRNITFAVQGKGAYGTLKSESGVHRLVRMSPFNAKKLRHTSFSLVEVIPEFKREEIEIAPDDLKVEFARSSGPGGQNVNKRETAVRLTHIPTGISVHCESERSQERNRESALQILRGKIYKRQEDERQAEEQGLHISKSADIEWGSQIRSYVLHPYKLVKDHRTDVETRDVESVLEEGDIDLFLQPFLNK